MRKMFQSVIFLFFAGMMSVSAQVNVGTNEDALPGAVMQWREVANVKDSTRNAYTGLAFPRVLLSDAGQLYPMFLADRDNPDSGAAEVYNTAEKKKALDQEHTGLVVYNLKDNPGKGLVSGLSVWNGSRWMSLTASAMDNGTVPGNPDEIAATYWPTNGKPDIRVMGTYVKGRDLTEQNTIEVDVNVTKAGNYITATDPIDGIVFSAEGSFSTTGKQTITLIGEGKPTADISIPLTIYFLSDVGITSCSATVPIMKPKMTYAIIGERDILSWYFWSREATRTMALRNQDNFGQKPNSIVKIEEFKELWVANRAMATDYLNNGYTGEQPDIVLYNTYGTGLNTLTENYLTENLAKALAAYVNKGGCLIFGAADDDILSHNNLKYTNAMLKEIYGGNLGLVKQPKGKHLDLILGLIKTDGLGLDNTYPIANQPLDPIINGPFGNLAGGDKYWGEDNGENVVTPKLPPKAIQICSARNTYDHTDVEAARSMVWYDPTKNLFFFGDSAGSTDDPNYALGEIDFPALYVGGVPKSKSYGPVEGPKEQIYNAHLEMNAVAWAIQQALTSGINKAKWGN